MALLEDFFLRHLPVPNSGSGWCPETLELQQLRSLVSMSHQLLREYLAATYTLVGSTSASATAGTDGAAEGETESSRVPLKDASLTLITTRHPARLLTVAAACVFTDAGA